MESGGFHTMARQRTKWNKATKFKIALEAYKGDRSVTDIAEEHGVHPTQVHRWKKELMEHGPEIFAGKHDDDQQAVEAERDELYRKVGHQQVQIDFLKKKLGVDQLPSFGK
jgi:transposase-like protein